ncbi:glutamic acid-rich protein-like [Papaver somniferum]|uniref:glutamic acid-rich protein-like n=1 Tax=Papaver somniferum TaxID=3469 RepID=UPI000E704038|nr:glutamic acid-rich protein-like [Papaver somniferum]
MPSGIGEIRGDLRDAKECITKDVHNYEEKLRKKMKQRKKVSEERRSEQLIVFTIQSRKELSGTQEDEEETNKAKICIEEYNNAIPEEGGQVNQKQGGMANKGKVAEGNEMTKNKKETPTTKEKQIPREGGKMNRSRGKKAHEQKAEESIEIQNSHNKLRESREDEEMDRLKEELYQERRRKEDLVRERIRLERENEKLIIRNNHLKRKHADCNMQEERYAMGEARTK